MVIANYQYSLFLILLVLSGSLYAMIQDDPLESISACVSFLPRDVNVDVLRSASFNADNAFNSGELVVIPVAGRHIYACIVKKMTDHIPINPQTGDGYLVLNLSGSQLSAAQIGKLPERG